ncbi:MAG UNVERIFIED_CONTAM: hypothetical protein LVR29_13855 [Microcystis novacekii LVE1205-3]
MHDFLNCLIFTLYSGKSHVNPFLVKEKILLPQLLRKIFLPGNLTAVGNTLFFTARDGVN